MTAFEPASEGVAVSVVFAGEWQLSLSNASADTVAVLDAGNRPFLRIGPGGVEGDYGAPAWYRSAVVDRVGRPPEGIGPDSAPDWQLVTRERAWSWFEPRIQAEPGLVSGEMIAAGSPARLRDFTVPLRIGERPGRITGYLEFEPQRGVYRHALLGNDRPAPGVEIGLLGGQAIATLTLSNDSDQTVTLLGRDGEPMARIDGAIEVNLASPTWVEIGRSLGMFPTTVADPGAEAQWRRLTEGRRMSWPDQRGRPPDTEPRAGILSSDAPVVVRRWTIPLLVGDQRVDVRGATSFVPLGAGTAATSRPGRLLPVAVVGGTLAVAVAVLWPRLRRFAPRGAQRHPS